MSRKKLTISFGDYDEDIYNFLREQKNASAFIRHMMRGYLDGKQINSPTPVVVQKVEEPIVETKSKSLEEENLIALQELDF